MTDKEVLEKAIQKAIDGGWDICDYSSIKDKHKVFNRDFKVEDDGIYDKGPYACHECGKPDYTVFDIIFNHDFAKALWGDEWKSAEILNKLDTPISEDNVYRIGTIEPSWQWHLKNMVISEDPIKYLGQNI